MWLHQSGSPLKSKLDDEDPTSMVQIVGCDVLSLNCLYKKNHVLWRLLAYASSSQKIDNLNKTKL